MNIYEVQTRTPLLIQNLLMIWEKSVRATHQFLSDAEIRRIREYVPQALNGVAHLVVAEREPNDPDCFYGSRA